MKKYSILLLLTFFVAACGGGGDDDPDDVTIKKDKITITERVELLGDGDSKNVPISATCDWAISEPDGWLIINPMRGGKNVTSISFSAGKNTTGVARSTTITISGGKAQTIFIKVTQQKASDSQEPSSSGEPSADDNQPPT